ncbi:hypothetical protein BpHYR1_017466 [Brachionus plicatilis]|uniref:Uncharacterized protein n=1 Tax=Brachionus plicatilis TaxID=10195 RepID=A0A3M7PGN8_BRAPC|nr:hypothetical protein BpHYR1_017466 [Brachionus plicatilis]
MSKEIVSLLPSYSSYFLEAWHNAFSNMIIRNPSVYTLVDMFQTGIRYKRKPKYILLDERINEIVKTYSLDTSDKFYDNLFSILDHLIFFQVTGIKKFQVLQNSAIRFIL